MKQWRLIIGLIVLLIGSQHAGAHSMADISVLIRDINSAPTIQERVALLERMEECTRDIDPTVPISERDVLIVASFLDDENRESVHFAAMVLGNLGKRAIVAIPLLEESMNRLDAEERLMLVQPAQPLATQIYVALSKIDGRPIPRGMGRMAPGT